MLRLSCGRATPSRRARVCSCCATFVRRWQTTRAESHVTKDRRTSGIYSRYPFPTHPNPTPFQIFHLPTNAPPEAIKARYYELVKAYHPDAVAATLSQGSSPPRDQGTSSSPSLTPEIAQARFQAVTKAYDSLRKGKAKGKAHLAASPFAGSTEGRMSARRRRELRDRAELRVGDDERWRERLIVGALFATMMIFVYQTFETRREGLAIAAAANSRANGRRRPFEETRAAYPPPEDPTRNKQTIEDESRLAAPEDA